jgi:hypothetical protein
MDAAGASRSAGVFPWTVGIEISGTRIDGEGLVRLEQAFKGDVPHFEADCALWSHLLAVQGVVESSEDPREALASALATVSSVFDKAGIDINRASAITTVSMRRAARRTSGSNGSLPEALLRLASPSRRS